MKKIPVLLISLECPVLICCWISHMTVVLSSSCDRLVRGLFSVFASCSVLMWVKKCSAKRSWNLFLKRGQLRSGLNNFPSLGELQFRSLHMDILENSVHFATTNFFFWNRLYKVAKFFAQAQVKVALSL